MNHYPSMELAPEQFGRISTTMRDTAGIRLPPGKETLVKSRLSKRLRALRLPDFEAYLRFIDDDESGGELREMIDALTTNKTSFFRESAHYDHFVREVVEPVSEASGLTIWSAGCSTGEEPYTLSMLLREHGREGARHRILATDISGRALAVARDASYGEALLREVPEALRRRHFTKRPDGRFQVVEATRAPVSFGRLNLMGPWPMKGPFDVVFCRNVMIYFDREIRERLVGRFHGLLRPGGYLYVGHSESLTGLEHPFQYVRPAVYRR